MATEWMSIRSSIDMHLSRNASTSSSPCRSTNRRMRAPWLAISSIILREVCAKYALFLKKSQWPYTWAMTSFWSTAWLLRIR